jgi:hypothetical protein
LAYLRAFSESVKTQANPSRSTSYVLRAWDVGREPIVTAYQDFPRALILQKGDTPMTVEPIDRVSKLWETRQITTEQVIGKILLWLCQLHRWLLKLEAGRSGSGRQ